LKDVDKSEGNYAGPRSASKFTPAYNTQVDIVFSFQTLTGKEASIPQIKRFYKIKRRTWWSGHKIGPFVGERPTPLAWLRKGKQSDTLAHFENVHCISKLSGFIWEIVE